MLSPFFDYGHSETGTSIGKICILKSHMNHVLLDLYRLQNFDSPHRLTHYSMLSFAYTIPPKFISKTAGNVFMVKR